MATFKYNVNSLVSILVWNLKKKQHVFDSINVPHLTFAVDRTKISEKTISSLYHINC